VQTEELFDSPCCNGAGIEGMGCHREKLWCIQRVSLCLLGTRFGKINAAYNSKTNQRKAVCTNVKHTLPSRACSARPCLTGVIVSEQSHF